MNIEKSIKLFTNEIEQELEEREEGEILDFDECLDDAIKLIKEYCEEQNLELPEYDFSDYYLTEQEKKEEKREVYVQFEII